MGKAKIEILVAVTGPRRKPDLGCMGNGCDFNTTC